MKLMSSFKFTNISYANKVIIWLALSNKAVLH